MTSNKFTEIWLHVNLIKVLTIQVTIIAKQLTNVLSATNNGQVFHVTQEGRYIQNISSMPREHVSRGKPHTIKKSRETILYSNKLTHI